MEAMLVLSAMFSFVLLSGIYAVPMERLRIERRDIIEGDILVTKPLTRLMIQSRRTRREVTTQIIKRWPKGVIPYSIDRQLGKQARRAIRKAIHEFKMHTCVQFVSHTDEKDYIHFNFDYGCYSPIGRQGGQQKLSVGEGCDYKGTVMHEMMHALGFFHEHSRYDRDKYVKILWWNVEPGFFKNFNSYGHDVLDTLKLPYDYNSLMHYDRLAFSKNRKNTIEAIGQPHRTLGQMDNFSETDIKQLLKVYPCQSGNKEPIPAQPKHRGELNSKHNDHCKDMYPVPCKQFASHEGYCQEWKSFMTKHCPVSCGFCQEVNRFDIWSSEAKSEQARQQ